MIDSDDELDWTAQLVMLRKLTQRFGTIHEAQALQLRMWPFVVNQQIEKSEATVDFDSKRVIFDWKTVEPGYLITSKYVKRLKELDNKIKFLLGNGWSTKVIQDGEAIFPIPQDTNVGKSRTKRGSSKRKPNKNRRGKR